MTRWAVNLRLGTALPAGDARPALDFLIIEAPTAAEAFAKAKRMKENCRGN